MLLCLNQLDEQASNALLCLDQLEEQAKHLSVLLTIAKTPCYKVDNFAERGFLLSNKGCLLLHQQLTIHNSQFNTYSFTNLVVNWSLPDVASRK